MKRNVNIIALFNVSRDKVLFCLRRDPPFQGLYNFVGGKIEPGEDGLTAAYRELWEETGVTRDDVTLVHLMDFTYYDNDTQLETYYGCLNKPFTVYGTENDLVWLDRQQNYFDPSVFAGMGNIGHIMAHIEALEQTEKA